MKPHCHYLAILLCFFANTLASAQSDNSLHHRDTHYSIAVNDSLPSWLPYVIFSGGVNLAGGSYGENYFNTDKGEYVYSGYAGNGPLFSITTGITYKSGFEFTGYFSYNQNHLDAYGYLNENANLLLDDRIIGGNTSIVVNNINPIGNYNYSNISYLIGLTQNVQDKFFSCGVSIMVGGSTTIRPTINSTATVYVFNGNSSPSTDNSTWSIDKYSQNSAALAIGTHVDIKFAHHFIFRASLSAEFSTFSNIGYYQLIGKNGNIIFTDNLSSGNTSLGVSVATVSLGVGYAFYK